MSFQLRNYQDQSIEKLQRGWLETHGTNFHKNQLLVLATGLGKTVVFSNIAKWVYEQFKEGRVLILAHREELLEQAEEKLIKVMGIGAYQAHTLIQREQGKNYAREAPIVSASVPTWGVNRGTGEWNERMSRFPRNYFKLIIIDEAHHATASTYQHIMDYFSDAWVLGVTATPKRGDKESLKKVFSRVAFKMDIVDGMKEGWLCPAVSHRYSSKTSLGSVKTTAGDFNLKQLAKTVNNDERNDLVLKAYLDQCTLDLSQKHRQCIVFATDLDHARALREDFVEAGVSCETISGDMNKDDRKKAIADFKAGRIKVLTNFGVLTEGFDYEELDLIISARPTKSNLLLTQILGRGTRWPKHLMPDKVLDFVEIIDLHSEETATAASIFGFHKDFDCNGISYLDCINIAEHMEKEKEYFSPWGSKSYEAMMLDFQNAMEVKGPQVAQKSPYFFDNRFRWVVTTGDNLILKHTDKPRDSDVSTKYILRVTECALGGYEGSISTIENRESTRLYLFDDDTRLGVVKKLESCVLKNWRHWDFLLNINAEWKQKAKSVPCSDAQYKLLKRMKLTYGKPQSGITKAEASDMLNRHFAR